MILYFNSNFNNIDDSSLQNFYDAYISNHLPHFKCPNPNCSHSTLLEKSTSYKRYVFYDCDTYTSINITVVYCPACDTYHAILPSFLVPFSSYTYPFVIRTLYQFFFGKHKGNKKRVCDLMRISRKVLNRFLSAFSQEEVRINHKALNLAKLTDLLSNIHLDLETFIYTFFHISKNSIFLLPSIRRFFYVIDFAPPNTWEK